MRHPTAGAALVAVVLITLALFAIAHGLLALALGELAASRAAARHLEARAAAESAVNRVLDEQGAAWLDSTAVGEARPLGAWTGGRARSTAMAWRIATESWWIEGSGRIGLPEARTARLGWAADPLTRVLDLAAALSVRDSVPLALGGTIEAGGPTSVDPPLDPRDCDPWIAELDARYAARPLSPVATFADTLPTLGRLRFAELLAAAEMTVSGSGSPVPVEAAGACSVGEPWNWGDPERPWLPCGPYLPLRAAAGTLDVLGGVGQGLLVVDGDLVLRGGARFYGLVIARGALVLEADARLVGMAIAAGGARLAPGSVLHASACWATRALAAQRATLGRLRAVPGVGVLGPI
jgi:hypothetical protein